MAPATGTTDGAHGASADPSRATPAAPAASPGLTAPQLHALFDILTHHETYREVQDFKDPATIGLYGTPFAATGSTTPPGASTTSIATPSSVTYAARSTSPILHMLFNKAVLTLPPAKALPAEFWHVRVQSMIRQLAAAELSESYDQGAMGTRKLLATAASAMVESLGRGALGGYRGGSHTYQRNKTYDRTDAVELAQAWEDVLHAMVYGDLVDELFAFCAEHGRLEDHSPGVRAAIDYILIHLAEFLHSVFVLSPNGRYLAKLAGTLHMLAPYASVRQVLRLGNAASVINGIMRLLLAKISVGGLTNWIGLTSEADDGMNLLQRVVATVMSLDASSMQKTADRIERAKDGPGKVPLAVLREHLAKPRAVHEATRRQSMATNRSMVACILDAADPSLTTSLSDAHHAQCAQYYQALLSVRDRRQIETVFCRQRPDLLTQAVKDGMAALDPLIRGIHAKIDLSEHISDFEGFVGEFVAMSSKSARTQPTVRDYYDWMTRHRHLLYKWLHRVARDTPDIRDMFRGWAAETIKLFRGREADADANADAEPKPEPGPSTAATRVSGGAGALSADLQAMFAALGQETQGDIVLALDAHAAYLAQLDAAAIAAQQDLLDRIFGEGTATPPAEKPVGGSGVCGQGSGRFLAHWHNLLDATVIGPATKEGPLRCGRDVASITAASKVASVESNVVEARGQLENGKGRWGRKMGGLLGGFANAMGGPGASSPETASIAPSTTSLNGLPAGLPAAGTTAGLTPPSTAAVVDAMAEPFRQLLMAMGL